MFDASKYAEHFPDEQQHTPSVQAAAAAALGGPLPSPALLAALCRLEKEFSEILRAQQPEATDPCE
jgi:hypothetical protein